MQSLRRRLGEMAHTDPLTALPNRRGLDVALSRELARARRTGATLCLAVLDIDHFKRINDKFGHAVGDEALKHLANVLKPAVRETDTFARFGGEEFVLVLPDTPLPDAEFTLNRLLRTLERAPLSAAGTQVPVRFSAGLAQWAAQESAEQLMTRADQAMYAAKHAGRGRVMVAEEHPA
jgi:diguanylate cyclase